MTACFRPYRLLLWGWVRPYEALALVLVLAMSAARADSLDQVNSTSSLSDESAIAEDKESRNSQIDEITVVEQKSVIQLRADLNRLDSQIFSLYNTVNSNDSLDMICKKETRIGSQIKNRVCKSSYHRQLESESGSEALAGDSAAMTARVPSGHYKKVRANMANLMSEHPELLRAVNKRAILRRKIAELKAEK